VINDEFTVFDPLVGPVPTPILGLANGTANLMLNANGLPIFNDALTSPSLPFFVGPGSVGTATTVAATAAIIEVPTFDIGAFSRLGFAPLELSAQELMTFTTTPINPGLPVGTVIEESTLTNLTGTLIAFYTYTPFTPVPEPLYGGAIGAALLLIFLKKSRMARSRSRPVFE
jgi:hypothetical protein